MRGSYLLFDAVVFLPTLALSFVPSPRMTLRRRTLLWACLVVAIPFILWDAAVAGRHWFFSDAHTLPLRPLGLPVEEMLFFIAVPWSCVFLWETVLLGGSARPSPSLRRAPLLGWAFALLGLAALVAGREYTGFALLALALAVALDRARGTALWEQPRFFGFMAAVAGLGLVFNGYLTRFIVSYDDRYNLGIRVVTVPLEDFIYGAALVAAVTVLYQGRLGRVHRPSWVARAIERRLGGYRQTLVAADPNAPERAEGLPRVAVVGGGLAGLSAAALLAERGFPVTLFERNAYLGGKIGAWSERLAGGFTTDVEHGFHAFFRHYYNLTDFLERVGARAFASIGSYVILGRDGRRFTFDGQDRTPLLNVLALARKGLYSFPRVALSPARSKLMAFLQYDGEGTAVTWDSLPFSEFAAQAKLPPALRMVFSTFGRAFFAEDADLSTAELIKSFHFYYLSHDHGLVYDYVDGGYDSALLAPIAAHLARLRVDLRLGAPVERIERTGAGFRVADEDFGQVVVAADIAATKRLLAKSAWVEREDPALAAGLRSMKAGARYGVWRLWLDRRVGDDLPVFVSTERIQELDAVAFIDRVDPRCRAWADTHGGSVIELHSYALTRAVGDADAVRAALRAELEHFFPALRGAQVVHEYLQLRDDFTALHAGMRSHRPTTVTGVPGLTLAGDWVALPLPALLMEAAHTSGRLAANAVCRAHGLREYPVLTVPTSGLFASRRRAG